MVSLYCRTQNTLFRFYFSAEDLFTLTNNKFRMVYKVDGNPSLIHVIGACTQTSLRCIFIKMVTMATKKYEISHLFQVKMS